MNKTTKQSLLRRIASKGTSHQYTLALGLALAACGSGPLPAQVTLDPAWRVTPDTSKPGFKWSYFQAGSNTGNNNERTESDLAGLSPFPNLGDPTIIGGAIAEAAPANPTNGLLFFEITNVINLSKTDGGGAGHFPGDQLEPGINLTVSTDGQSAEILSYLTLPVGTNFMGVRSDDGFRCESGPNPQDIFGRRMVNERTGGSGDLVFEFVVPPGGAGTYPFRVIWENGGGDSHVEWYTADSLTPTARALVNDVANGGLPAYRAITGTAALPPYVKNVTPLPVLRQTEGAKNKITVALSDGTTPLNTNAIALQIDGIPQTVTIERSGSTVTVATPVLAGLRLAGESHTAMLTFKDTGTYSRTQQWSFMNLENLVLPATPVTGENFDAYPESTSPATTVPPGWIATNHTYVETAGWNVADVTSDSYLDFVMISTTTVLGIAGETLQNDQSQTINGIPLTDPNRWMSNNLLHAASDSRLRSIPNPDGVSPNISVGQLNWAISAPFNLSTVTNPVLTFSSGARLSGNKEQMTLEYSVDGVNWLPGIYMRNSSTVRLLPDGSYDAVTMCNEMDTNQIARWPTPGVGPKGGNFGDMIAAPISQALAPYFANRNDGVAARRVEAIRLPAASKQSAVRLRLTHAGSCGWDWGVDNIAFYDIAPPAVAATAATITSVVAEGTDVVLTWTGGTAPFLVQGVGALGGTWVDLYTTSSRTARIPRALSNMFLRVESGTTKTVTLFKSVLNGANERPNPVTTPGTGIGLLALNGTTASYWVTYSGLTAGATASHVHGPADANGSAGVLFGLGSVSGTAGVIAGTSAITATQAGHITAGNSYFNIHTSANTGGEIRGQLVPVP